MARGTGHAAQRVPVERAVQHGIEVDGARASSRTERGGDERSFGTNVAAPPLNSGVSPTNDDTGRRAPIPRSTQADPRVV